MIVALVFISSGKRQETVRSSLLAAICRHKVTVDEPLTPYDRITPMSIGGTPRTGNASEDCSGFADATSETYCRSSVSFMPLPDKDFYDRPVTCRLFQQSTGRDSDNPSSCVAVLSQTLPSGTGQFRIIETDGEWDKGDRLRQFHRVILHGILLLCRNPMPKDSVR